MDRGWGGWTFRKKPAMARGGPGRVQPGPALAPPLDHPWEPVAFSGGGGARAHGAGRAPLVPYTARNVFTCARNVFTCDVHTASGEPSPFCERPRAASRGVSRRLAARAFLAAWGTVREVRGGYAVPSAPVDRVRGMTTIPQPPEVRAAPIPARQALASTATPERQGPKEARREGDALICGRTLIHPRAVRRMAQGPCASLRVWRPCNRPHGALAGTLSRRPGTRPAPRRCGSARSRRNIGRQPRNHLDPAGGPSGVVPPAAPEPQMPSKATRIQSVDRVVTHWLRRTTSRLLVREAGALRGSRKSTREQDTWIVRAARVVASLLSMSTSSPVTPRGVGPVRGFVRALVLIRPSWYLAGLALLLVGGLLWLKRKNPRKGPRWASPGAWPLTPTLSPALTPSPAFVHVGDIGSSATSRTADGRPGARLASATPPENRHESRTLPSSGPISRGLSKGLQPPPTPELSWKGLDELESA